MTQINTPYPATAYLTGFLRSEGVDARQADPGITLILKLLSRPGLKRIIDFLEARYPGETVKPKSVRHFLYHREKYLAIVDSLVRFLQGRDPTLSYRMVSEGFIPRGPRFQNLPLFPSDRPQDDGLDWAFGALGIQDRAQYLASLCIDDLSDVIRDGVDPKFELSKYGEKLGASAPSFTPLLEALRGLPTPVDEALDDITLSLLREHSPDVVGFSIPFPGNLYGAFRMAKVIRETNPQTKIIFGGGYVNTELRELTDARVFDWVDFIAFDDGEKPLLSILQHLKDPSGTPLLRTLVREEGEVVWKSHPGLHDIPFKNTPTPTYDGLPISQYLSLCELPNPMHRLWSDGRWNKLTIAHGCYWKKCSFCDVTLDYIGRYEPQKAAHIVDRIETLIAETGQSGFHFVDEAAPPAVMAGMARELIRRNIQITWWANIRFEEAFDFETTQLLAQSGCVAVSGGLEVASDRLLKLMEKGVTVAQVARVTQAFTQSGIMVHAYLMYGFPTQTVQETIDSLERVRQLFLNGCIQSAFWHRFSVTVHSPIGKNPEKYGIQLSPEVSTFAKNDISFTDPTGVDHDSLYPGLRKALYNYMHGIGLDTGLRNWFDFPVPKPKVKPDLIASFLKPSTQTKTK